MRRILFMLWLILLMSGVAFSQGTTNYPTSLDTTTTLPQAVDQKVTFLTAAVTNVATSLTVNSTAGVPTSGVLQIDSELLGYSTADATHFTVTRAFSGTTAAPHSANATVRFPLVSAHVNGVRGATLAIEAAIGYGTGTAASASTGQCRVKQADGSVAWATCGSGTSGTVTSVGLSMPAEFSVSGSPVTSSGTLTVTRATQTANAVLAGPTSGGAAVPTFRALVNPDIPSTLSSKTFDNTNTANFKGTLFTLQDATDTTKQARFDLSNVSTATTRTVNIPDANSTTAQAKAAVSNEFLTAMSAQGVFSSARPTWANVDKTTSSLADITTRSASDLSSGTLPDARLPATLPAVSGVNLTALNASNLGSGTVPTARLGSGTASSSTYLRGDQTWAAPVTSITGTSNQVTASASTGAVTLSLPQNIHTSATAQFGSVGAGNTAPSGYQVYAYTNTVGVPSAFQMRSNYANVAQTFFGNFGDWGTIFAHNRDPQAGTFVNTAASPNQANAADLIFGRVNSAGGSPSRMFTFVNYPGGTETERLGIDWSGNVVVGPPAALSTSATNGFFYIPTTAGVPTGTPTTHTGHVPMVFDTTNSKLCIYSGSWKCVTF